MGGGISTNKIEHNNNNNNNNNNNHNNNKQILLYERIKLDYLLGEGGYSEVYHGIDKQTNKSIAVKRINLIKILQNNNNKIIIKDKADKDNNKEKENKDNKKNEGLESLNTIFTELNAFKRIGNHDFIVTLHSAFRHNVCCYLVMDCLSGGDLRHFLKINGSLNEESVVYIVGCIGSALHHMHSRGVIHRDVKPENIGLDTLGRPYLTDFGISLISSVDNPIPISESSSGTLPYLSPEVLSPGNCHSHQSDYWSLGVLAYELFFNRRPYRRHCPIHAIEFVSNEYGWIWNELKKKQTTQNHLKINFETINKTNISNVWQPPFPNLNIHLNEDGTVPPCLITAIPDVHNVSHSTSPDHSKHLTSHLMVYVSEEFRSLLNGLLDVRIPYRLGNMSRYHEFSNHSCFLKYDYNLQYLPDIASPLQSYHLEKHATSVPICSHSFSEEDDLILCSQKLSIQLQKQLYLFYYENPSKISTNCNTMNYLSQTSTSMKLKYETDHHHDTTDTISTKLYIQK